MGIFTRTKKFLISAFLFFVLLTACVSTISRIVENKKDEYALEVNRIEKFPEDKDFLVWLGHSTFLIKLNGTVFYTDPVIYDKVVIIKRLIPFPVEREKLPAPDFVVISHNHYDHMDIPSLRFLAEKSKKEGKTLYVFVPQRAAYYLTKENFKVVELPWEKEYEVKGLKIKSVKVKHFSGRNLFDFNFSLWNAYLISNKKVKIFFGGDTAYIKLPQLEPDIALMPIGAWKPRWFMKRNHVSPREAIQMSYEMGAKITIPMHYGTFRQGMDTSKESIKYMIDFAEKFGVKYLIPKPGEIIYIDTILSSF